jgi:hypothetical protein
VSRTKLDDDLLSDLVTALETLPIRIACDLVGIHESTYRRWVGWGEAGEEPYASFLELAKQSRAAYVQGRLRIIEQATTTLGLGKGDWKAAAWYLERCFPEHYARQTTEKQEISGPGGTPLFGAQPDPQAVNDALLILINHCPIPSASGQPSGPDRGSGDGGTDSGPASAVLPAQSDGAPDGVSAD